MALDDVFVGDGHLNAVRGVVMSWGGVLLMAGLLSPFLGFWMGVTEHELRDIGPLWSLVMIGAPGLLLGGITGAGFLWSGLRLGDGRTEAWFGCFGALVTLILAFWPLAIYGFWSLTRAPVRRFCGLK